jgi:leader peptidase (prepilin peptidase)/N-methyltransferase
VSLDHVNLAAVAGAAAGLVPGLAAGALGVVVNLVTRKTVRLPEPLAYGLWALALVLTTTTFTIGTVDSVAGSVMAAGAFAMVGAVFWWVHDLIAKPTPATGGTGATAATTATTATAATAATTATATTDVDGDDEPVAMGFGDVKLAAVLGAFLGWELLLVGIFLAVTIGAIGGLIGRIVGGKRMVPFGPYLVMGALCALFFGGAIIDWYLGLLGAG